MRTTVVLRPVATGAAATALGCYLAAAPTPAGAAFAGCLAAALLAMLGWSRRRPRHHRPSRQGVTLTSSSRKVDGVPSSSVLVQDSVTVLPRYGVRSTT
jgi:hypothetical protein